MSATAAVVLVNVLMALFGLGLILLLGIARTPRQLLHRSPLAYAVGLAATGVLGAALELVRAPLGPVELTVLAVASLGGGAVKLLTGDAEDDRPGPRPSWASYGVGWAALGLSLALVVHAAHAYSVRPLREWDGWVIWATKARALYEHGGADASVFANAVYEHEDYPLLLPTLEAIGFRAIGSFDGTALHLQLAGLALAFVLAGWTISRATASPAVTGLAILAAVSAPAFFNQLGWAYADVPVAMLCALAVGALAAWLHTGERWLLVCAAVFLAATASTKSEGLLFALAALGAAGTIAAVARRGLIRTLLVAGGAFLAAILPWRIFVLAHGLHPQDYELSSLLDPSYLADSSGRVRPAAGELLSEMARTDNWGLLLPLAACALAAALLRGRLHVAGFAALWMTASFAGLVLVYWISTHSLEEDLSSSSYRTIAALLVGAALLVPPLVGEIAPRRDGKEA